MPESYIPKPPRRQTAGKVRIGMMARRLSCAAFTAGHCARLPLNCVPERADIISQRVPLYLLHTYLNILTISLHCGRNADALP
jgi:hypothetical protein